ncbi:MAG: YtxH domain-containing protein [Bacteroides sp.]|nr:YtxH domain-containing protein [Bacteroides sp.]
MGVGAILGAVACRFSSTARAKMLKMKVDHALHKAHGEAEDFLGAAKEHALKTGTKVVDKVADKAEDVRNRVHTIADSAK